MSTPLLSILMPGIPSRMEKIAGLYARLQALISAQGAESEIEVLCFIDNKNRSIGSKRQGLLDLAKGNYVCFLDDDDDFTPRYVEALLDACRTHDVHVISFDQLAYVHPRKEPYVINFSLLHKVVMELDAEKDPEYVFTRPPFHICCWRRLLAQQYRFPDVGYGEDWEWVKQMLPHAILGYHIPEVLHIYRYSPEVSEAPTESNAVWKNPN